MPLFDIKLVLIFADEPARDAFTERLPDDFVNKRVVVTQIDPSDPRPGLIIGGQVQTRARLLQIRDQLLPRLRQADVQPGTRIVIHKCMHDVGQPCTEVTRYLKVGGDFQEE